MKLAVETHDGGSLPALEAEQVPAVGEYIEIPLDHIVVGERQLWRVTAVVWRRGEDILTLHPRIILEPIK
jgi:hypothetical protein